MFSIDLRAFKGVFYDLDEIGLALDRPGQEALGRARKAAGRLRGFLATVPQADQGAANALGWVERALTRLARPAGFFSGSAEPALSEARRDLERLRLYLEGLHNAWRVCALDSQWADRAAGWC